MYTSVAHGKIILACEERRKMDLGGCSRTWKIWCDFPVVGKYRKWRGGRRMNNDCCQLEKNWNRVLIADMDLIHVICIHCGKEWVEWNIHLSSLSVSNILDGIVGIVGRTIAGASNEIARNEMSKMWQRSCPWIKTTSLSKEISRSYYSWSTIKPARLYM